MICNKCGATIADNSAFCPHCGVGFYRSVYENANTAAAGDVPAESEAPKAAPQAAPQAAQPTYAAPMYQQQPYYQQQPVYKNYNTKSFVEIMWESVSCKLAAFTAIIASFLAAFIGIFMSFAYFGGGFTDSSAAILVLFGAVAGIYGSYLCLSKAKVGAVVLAHSIVFMFLHTGIYMWDTASILATVLMSVACALAFVAAFVPKFPLAERPKKN